MRRMFSFGFSTVALAAFVMLLAPPNPAHAMFKGASDQLTITITAYAGDPFNLAEIDFSVPVVIDRHESTSPKHDAICPGFGIGHYSLTESMQHSALAFALVGNAAYAPEVASPPSIAG